MRPAWQAVLLGFLFLSPLRAGEDRLWLQRQVENVRPGATIDVPAGVYAGPIVLDKTLRLRGAPGAVIEGSGKGHVVEILAPDVEVGGFVIRRSGNDPGTDDSGVHVRGPRAWVHHNTIVDTLIGIYLHKAPECRLTHNVIRGRASREVIADPLTQGLKLSDQEMCSVELQQDRRGNGIHIWNCSNHLIADNNIRGTRDGIYFQFCDQTQILRNTITDVRYGLHYMYSDENVFEENTFSRNAAGSAIMYSHGITLRRNRFVANRSHRAYGILLHTVETTRIEDNLVEGNTVGIFLENSTANAVHRNNITANYIGLRLSDSSDDNHFSTNTLRSNVHAVELGGSTRTNRFTREGVGNYWQDALKLDLDRNGIADVPHHETDLFGPWRRTFPEIGLLSGSPGERAIRFMHSRIHVPGIPGVKDDRPLARPIRK